MFLPDAPALLPSLGGEASAPLRQVRAVCTDAIGPAGRARWAAIGVDPAALVVEHVPANRRISQAPYGRPGEYGLSEHAVAQAPDSPAALLVAAWLRERAALPDLPVILLPPTLSESEARSVADSLGQVDQLIVLGSGTFGWEPGDGTDQHSDPGDLATAAALKDGDPAGLARAATTADSSAQPASTEAASTQAGSAAWSVAAEIARNRPVDSTLLYSDAPFGVRYHVAIWDLR